MAGASGQWTENELGSMLSNWFREQSKRFPAPPMGANDLAAARPAGYYSGGRPSAQGEAQAMEQMATANALTEQLPLGGRISPEMWNFGKMNSASDLAKAKLMRDATEAAISVGLYGGQKAKGYAKARNKFSALWDKQPRFEIDDSASVFKGSTKPSAPLSEVLEHKSLYEQYPQLKRLNVEFKGDPSASVLNQGRRGSFGNNKITIDNVYSAKEAEKTLLHEVQHAIQEAEGFAPGGNPEIILNNAKKTANNLILRANTEIPKLRGDLMVAKDAAEKRIISGKIDYLWKSSQDAAQKVNSLDSFGQYKRLAGEFEARDAAARSALNATQRAGTKPYSSENIAVKDLIVNKSGGQAMSKVDDLAAEARKYETADEFVKAQGEPLYHGTPNASVKKLKVGKTQRTDAGNIGEGVYVTPQKFIADAYAKQGKRVGKTHEIYANVKKSKEILYDENYHKNIENFAREIGVKEKPIWGKVGNDSQSFAKEMAQKAKKSGYDSIKMMNIDGTVAEMSVFDPLQIKTKDQLIDIWKKANK